LDLIGTAPAPKSLVKRTRGNLIGKNLEVLFVSAATHIPIDDASATGKLNLAAATLNFGGARARFPKC
jgi:hypothetical protein